MKQLKYWKRLGIHVLIALIMVSALLPAGVRAETEWNNVITAIRIKDKEGNDPPEGGLHVWTYHNFRIEADFNLPQAVQAGDKTIITLPTTLEFPTDYDFEVKSNDGQLVANAHVDKSSKTLTLTYTDYPSGQASTTGSFFFYVRVAATQVTEPGNVDVSITVGGNVVIPQGGGSIHYDGPQPAPPGATMRKRGWQSEIPQQLDHVIDINQTKMTINNAVLYDELQDPAPGVTYVRDSFMLRKGTWITQAPNWVLAPGYTTSVPNVSFGTTADGRETFTLDLGNIGPDDGYQLWYRTKVNYNFANGEQFKNKAKLTGNGIENQEQELVINVMTGGGSAQGYVCTLKVKKVDESTGNVLAGVEFKVTRKANGQQVGTITTGVDGTGELGGLLYDTYIIEEIAPPAGYLPIDPIEVKPGEFGENYTCFKTISNKPNKTISIPVSKTWVGPAAGPVTVRLLADGVNTEKTLTLKEDNGWMDSFTDLPKYGGPDGHEIAYTVVETNPPAGYTPSVAANSAGGFTITNTNTETISIPVSKTWVGPAAGPVTVQLKADGADVPGKTIELSAPGWAGSFDGLPKCGADGHEIAYTVEETNPPAGYAHKVTGSVADGFVITNTLPGPVEWSYTFNKTLYGKDNIEDGEFSFQLLDQDHSTVLATYTNVGDTINIGPRSFDKPGEYTYYVKEVNSGEEGMIYDTREYKFEITVTLDHNEGKLKLSAQLFVKAPGSNEWGNLNYGSLYSFENKYTLTEVEATKTWVGGSEPRPKVWLRLARAAEEQRGGPPVLDAGWEWVPLEEAPIKELPTDGVVQGDIVKVLWSKLKAMNEHGIPYRFRVYEVDAAGNDYTPPGYVKKEEGLTVTNTYKPELISISVKKTWVGPAAGSVTVQLKADGTAVPGKTLELNEAGSWTGSFTDLPKHAADSHEIVYTVEEVTVPGYASLLTGSAENGFTITNTIEGKVSVGVTKKWVGPAAESVTVKLMNGMTEVAKQVLSKDNNWQHTFVDLPQYDDSGNEITYTIEEETVPGYSSEITGDMKRGFVVTNSNTARITIPVKKQWVGTPAAEVTIRLMNGGKEVASGKLNAGNNWQTSFADLPKYDGDGKEILYTIKEDSVEGYSTVISGNQALGFTVTNTVTGKVSIPVTKVWKGKPLERVTIHLLADGKELAKQELHKGNAWQHTFTDLEKYLNGKEINYSITEDPCPSYVTEIVRTPQNGFVVTNSELTVPPTPPHHNPPPRIEQPTPKPTVKERKDASVLLPRTGEKADRFVYGLGFVLLALGSILLRKKLR